MKKRVVIFLLTILICQTIYPISIKLVGAIALLSGVAAFYLSPSISKEKTDDVASLQKNKQLTVLVKAIWAAGAFCSTFLLLKRFTPYGRYRRAKQIYKYIYISSNKLRANQDTIELLNKIQIIRDLLVASYTDSSCSDELIIKIRQLYDDLFSLTMTFMDSKVVCDLYQTALNVAVLCKNKNSSIG